MRALLLIILSMILISCGGGSEGTGTRTVAGVIKTVNSEPVTDARVTILQTGDFSITDSSGNFSIETEQTTGSLTLEIVTETFSVEAEVSEIEDEASSVSVEITVDPTSSTASISDIHIWARMVGSCDLYFENRTIIRQSNKVPQQGIDCVLKFFASGEGQRLERIPGAIQVRSCDSKKWSTIAEGITGIGLNAGVGQIEFRFKDSESTCEYRLAAPYEVAGVKPLFVYISTFTLQKKK